MMNINDKNHQVSTYKSAEVQDLISKHYKFIQDMYNSKNKRSVSELSKKKLLEKKKVQKEQELKAKVEQKVKEEAERKKVEAIRLAKEEKEFQDLLKELDEERKAKLEAKKQKKEAKAEEKRKAKEAASQEEKRIREKEKLEALRYAEEVELALEAYREEQKREREQKAEEKRIAKEVHLLEVKNARESKLKRKQAKEFEKEQIKKQKAELKAQQNRLQKIEKARKPKKINRKTYKKLRLSAFRAVLVAAAFAIGSFVVIKETGLGDSALSFFKNKFSEFRDDQLMAEAKLKSKNPIVIYDDEEEPTKAVVTQGAKPTVKPTSTPMPTPTEVVIEEKHETIDTSYYNDANYKFDAEITAEYLKELNPTASATTAWITIPGTNVNYPVVLPSVDKIDDVKGLRKTIEKSGKSEYAYMNEYYLHKNLAEEYSERGTVYMDVSNKGLNQHFDEISDHSVIYGHHMKNGSMFHDVSYYVKDSYLNEHPYAIIYTDDGYGYMLEFVAVRLVNRENGGALHSENFRNVNEKKEYVQSIMNEAQKNNYALNENYVPQDDDKYISLITCSHEVNGYVVQLIGKISGKIQVRDSSLTNDENGYYVESNNSTLHR